MRIMTDNSTTTQPPEYNKGEPVEIVGYGGAVKALDNGRVAGYLVTFGGKDLTGEYFAPDTDYGEPDKLPVLYHHGFDPVLKARRIGTAKVERDEFGLWAEAQLNLANEYERYVYELAQAGKIGWSSGAAAHTVEKDDEGERVKITQWYMAEASLTPTPAEPRNVVTIKSLQVQAESEQDEQGKLESDAEPETVAINQPVQDNEVKKMEMTTEQLEQLIADTSEKAVKAYVAETEPVVKKTDEVKIDVVKDEGDRLFANLAEQAQAVKDYTKSLGRKTDPRLARLMQLKAVQGAAEGSPADGGILLEPTLTAEVMKPVHEEGAFSAGARRLPVSANSNFGYINGVDETSRATGSRWGGIRGYRLAEGDALTKSKPSFSRINWELKKYGVLVYGTDELLADVAQFSAIVQQASREELSFMLNDDILNGVGLAGPQGIMQSGALISVTRTDANKVLHDDIVNMWARMETRSKAGAKWYINSEVQPQLDKLFFSTGTDGVLSPYVSYRDGVMSLFGKPVVETEFNAALGTAGDIVLADMSQYLTWEKQGVQAQSSIHVEFLTDQEVFRFIYRCDGKTAMSSPVTPYKGSNTRSAFVALTAAS